VSTDSNGLNDEVIAELNAPPAEASTDAPRTLPDRPAASAARGEWVDYCVALGAHRARLEGQTAHYDPDAEVTRTELVPVSLPNAADPFDTVDELIGASASVEEFLERARAAYESAQIPAAEREYREVTHVERGGYVTLPALTKAELVELAGRLGG
jgi:hypothetical protein